MTQTREFYAATVADAVQKASSALGVPAEGLSYKVLDEGSAGFLGIGARDARIAVEIQEDSNITALEEQPASVRASSPAEDYATPPEHLTPGDNASKPEHTDAPADLLREIEGLVASFVKAMGFEARVDVYDAGEFIAVDVASDNTALFIGQKGETIDALQYLVNSAMYRKQSFVKRIILDAEGYRQRRVEAIQGMAHRTARRAVRERRTVELPPMSASERRIVHLFLRDNPKVTTISEGAGENRRVRVTPV